MENNYQIAQNLGRSRRIVFTLQRQLDELLPQLDQIQHDTGISAEEVRRQAEQCRRSLEILTGLLKGADSRSALSREILLTPVLYGPPSVFYKAPKKP